MLGKVEDESTVHHPIVWRAGFPSAGYKLA